MLKNYLKIAIRNLRKQKIYTLINIFGLAIGMACSMLILRYIQYELSYDKFHKNVKQIYRIVSELSFPNRIVRGASTPAPMAPELLNDFPEIVSAVRMIDFTFKNKVLITCEEQRFEEELFFLTDPSIFDVFTLPFIKGDPGTALEEPYSLVITEQMAKKYFGKQDPLGKVLTLNNSFDFKITGILKSVPSNSHLRFNFLAPMACADDLYEGILKIPVSLGSWRNFNCNTYLLLQKDYDPVELEKKMPLFLQKHHREGAHSTDFLKIYLQPLAKIHLYSDFDSGAEITGDIKYIYLFSAIAFFILLIACINFINLSTARFANRAKEVGLRKVVGANRSQLVKQFLGESLLMSFLALMLAIVLVELLLPAFNSLVIRKIAINYANNWVFLLGLIGIGLFVGLGAGSYPAFFLSGFQPVNILKGVLTGGAQKSSFRNALVVIQFTISIFLIIATLVIYFQLQYIKNKKLGFNKEQVLVLPIKSSSVREKYESVKMRFMQNPNVIAATASSRFPGGGTDTWSNIEWQGYRDPEPTSVKIMRIDYDFIEAFDLELVAGRNFSREMTTDLTQAIILNESAVKKTGWKSPIGKRFGRQGFGQGYVIGVVRDFHFSQLHRKIEPLVLRISPRWFQYIAVKIRTEHISSTMNFLKKIWQEFHPNQAFEYFFLDDYFDNLYRSEERLGRIFGYFACLAIFIACLGLFGLAAFTAEQRTKEIGIRKVMGALVANIVFLLSKDFIKTVLLANLLAWPVAWYAMNRWLQNFAYRIDISWWVFALAGGLALVIALLTVSTQAIRAAMANPVESLRYE